MAKRRGHGEGSIYQRSDGRWCGSVEVPGGSGRRPRKYVYGKTRAEVQKKVDQARRAIESGLPAPNDLLTVKAFLDWWITEHVPTRVRSRTLPSYEQKARHITRLLGRVRLTRLTPTQVERAYDQLLREGHNAGGVRAIKRVFTAALNVALKEGFVVRNVAAWPTDRRLRIGRRIPSRWRRSRRSVARWREIV
jgi:hypothetical protein